MAGICAGDKNWTERPPKACGDISGICAFVNAAIVSDKKKVNCFWLNSDINGGNISGIWSFLNPAQEVSFNCDITIASNWGGGFAAINETSNQVAVEICKLFNNKKVKTWVGTKDLNSSWVAVNTCDHCSIENKLANDKSYLSTAYASSFAGNAPIAPVLRFPSCVRLNAWRVSKGVARICAS